MAKIKLYRYLKSVSGELNVTHLDKKVNATINANVLVIEDNEVNQMVVTGMLENIGCKITIAENGQAGLDALRKTSFDIVFMDINMPVLNGCDATKQYRKNEGDSKHLPIIALTANVLPEDVNTYYEAGMDDYMPKPFSADILREILNKWVPQLIVEQKEDTARILPSIDASNMDAKAVEELMVMMGDGYSQLVDTYIDRSLKLKKDIIDNINDDEKLTRDVHSLKGSSGTMGAKALFSICEEFELLLRKGNASNKENAVEKIFNELNAVHEYLISQSL